VSDTNLLNYQEALFERVCSMEELRAAFKAVRRNRGAAGIDGVTVEAFESKLDRELAQLSDELRNWTYRPQPVRAVEIPKPTGGVRMLGIPTVRDRVVHAAIKAVLEPILEPTFSDHSYGFRPGRNQRQAVEAARKWALMGKRFVVDIDLSRFFDRIHHDRLIYLLSKHILDKRILRLVGMTLRSGIMKDGLVRSSTEGSVQGSPLSPLLSNVVLDELDKELERRGLVFCRYADDCNIFVGSQNAADRVMQSVTRYIEGKLKLVVNREKSKAARSRYVRFLGMTIAGTSIAISGLSMKRAMEKVRQLTPRGTNHNIEQAVKRINEWYVGWAGYYGMTQYPSQLVELEAHIRRRLRSRLIDQHKRRRFLFEKMVKRGVDQWKAGAVIYSDKGRWALSHTQVVEVAYPNRWFRERLGLKIMSRPKQPHWHPKKRWIRLI
jgi:group II intron reverse transcriptase/maturase